MALPPPLPPAPPARLAPPVAPPLPWHLPSTGLQWPPSFGLVGPLTGNPAANLLPPSSLLTQFPELESSVIMSLIQHDFKGRELYKLDLIYRDKADRGVLQWEEGSLQLKAEPS